MGQKIIIFGGPDRCGKTTIAQELSRVSGIPYFKPTNQQWFAMNDPQIFEKQTRWAEPKLLDFLKQTGHSAIMDRGFPCDWVYSKVLGRETAWDTIEELDKAYAELGALFVVTLRNVYLEGDDAFKAVTVAKQRALHEMYNKYAAKSHMNALVFTTSNNPEDWDLDDQVDSILTYFDLPRKDHR